MIFQVPPFSDIYRQSFKREQSPSPSFLILCLMLSWKNAGQQSSSCIVFLTVNMCPYMYISCLQICRCPDFFHSVLSKLISKQFIAELCVLSYYLQQDQHKNICHLLHPLVPLQSLFFTEQYYWHFLIHGDYCQTSLSDLSKKNNITIAICATTKQYILTYFQ